MRRPSKILIVDDEPDNVEYLAHTLAGLGYATVSAGNGQEALEKVAAESPDLVLLDVVMPVLDGLAACRILKGNDETRLIPVVIMTALDDIEARIAGIEAGADDFLIKPVNQRELIARIRTALKLKHTMDHKLGELRRIRDHLAKFVPEAVRRLVAANPAAPELAKRERDVSVLFLDISGYTALSEQLSTEELNSVIERYFSAFLDHIHDADGDINETAGDGFMAIFQDADLRAHAIKAVETALALLAATEVLNRETREYPLSIRMGINTGTALVGSTRFEGFRGTRWTFTASGPVTNLAARLAAAAPPGQILAGPETVRRLGDRYRLESIGREQLRNLPETTHLYRILGPSARR